MPQKICYGGRWTSFIRDNTLEHGTFIYTEYLWSSSGKKYNWQVKLWMSEHISSINGKLPFEFIPIAHLWWITRYLWSLLRKEAPHHIHDWHLGTELYKWTAWKTYSLKHSFEKLIVPTCSLGKVDGHHMLKVFGNLHWVTTFTLKTRCFAGRWFIWLILSSASYKINPVGNKLSLARETYPILESPSIANLTVETKMHTTFSIVLNNTSKKKKWALSECILFLSKAMRTGRDTEDCLQVDESLIDVN